MSALFDFKSFVSTLALFVCACTYVKLRAPGLIDSHRTGFRGVFWKAARVGERLSPFVSALCAYMAVHTLFV